jgi:hypothetical protein
MIVGSTAMKKRGKTALLPKSWQNFLWELRAVYMEHIDSAGFYCAVHLPAVWRVKG